MPQGEVLSVLLVAPRIDLLGQPFRVHQVVVDQDRPPHRRIPPPGFGWFGCDLKVVSTPEVPTSGGDFGLTTTFFSLSLRM